MNKHIACLSRPTFVTLLFLFISVLGLDACGDAEPSASSTVNGERGGSAGETGGDTHCTGGYSSNTVSVSVSGGTSALTTTSATGGNRDCSSVNVLSGTSSSEDESERLACVRAAFQRAIDAPQEADGSYRSEVIIGTPHAPSNPAGFGIAVIDSGPYIPALTIYRNRVIGHYTLAGDHYEAAEPNISLPSPLARLMMDTLGVNQDYASSIDTAELAGNVVRKYNLSIGGDYAHKHGDWIFNALAELNPLAYFLLFHEDGLFSTGKSATDKGKSFGELVCAIRDVDGAANLHSYFRNRGKSIANIINDARAKGANIRFVNLSAGYDRDETVKVTTKVKCPEIQFTIDEIIEFQRAYAEFLEQIAAADVVLVQAAVENAGERITEANWEQWYADCAPIVNRVRVGYAFGATDAPAIERLDGFMNNALRCIDILVGMGWNDMETWTDRAFAISSLGLAHSRTYFVGSSIAAPLGLSLVAQFWQQGHEQLDSAHLAAAFRSDLSGIPIFKDVLEDHLFLNSREDYINNLPSR